MTTYSTQEVFEQPTTKEVKTVGWGPFKRQIYRLMEDYYFEYGPPGVRSRWFMAAGFEFDGASTTLLFAWLGVTPVGEHFAGSMFHDRLWRDKGYQTPGEFYFETQMEDGSWKPDSSRWHTGESNDLFQFMSQCGGLNKPMAFTERAIVVLFPINWFKRF